jgi:hypothetical protein
MGVRSLSFRPSCLSWGAWSSLLVLLAASTASAKPTVDWAKGLVTAEGIGIADRHAPNPAVARGTSRRGAEDAARAQLAQALGALPVAAGGTVADRAADPAVKARLDRAVAQAIAVAAQPETDGAWRVTMAVPIEAIRQALDAGPRTVTTGDREPAVVVVDGVTAMPAIGWTVGTTHAATVWVAAPPAWAKDAPHVKATAAKGGAIELATPAGSDATLYVIVMAQH